jgi:uncharacterized protein (TIGR02271 family)
MVSPQPTPQPPPRQDCTTVSEELVIPEINEFATIEKQLVETGAVRIHKHVEHVEKRFHPTLSREEVRVERIPVNRIVKEPPPVRTEGDTTIVPVLEEVLVKLLLVKEEVHITRIKTEAPGEERPVTLRREEITVERTTSPTSPAPSGEPTTPHLPETGVSS